MEFHGANQRTLYGQMTNGGGMLQNKGGCILPPSPNYCIGAGPVSDRIDGLLMFRGVAFVSRQNGRQRNIQACDVGTHHMVPPLGIETLMHGSSRTLLLHGLGAQLPCGPVEHVV